VTSPQCPAWIGTPELSPVAAEMRADVAGAFRRSMTKLELSPDDRIRVVTQMLAFECAQAPSLPQAQAANAYVAWLLAMFTIEEWHARVDRMLAQPQGNA